MAAIDSVEYTHIAGVMKTKMPQQFSKDFYPQTDKQKENRSPQRL